MIKHEIDDSAWVWRMRGLKRNGTAEPVSRGRNIRRETKVSDVNQDRENSILLFSQPQAGFTIRG